LHGAKGDLRAQIQAASEHAARRFAALTANASYERWQLPISSLLMIEETPIGVHGVDLGDCRAVTLDASGASFVAGGPEDAADDESALAAQQTDADRPLLQRADTIAMLRRMRGELNQPGSRWTFCLDPACAGHARAFSWTLQRPAHILLMTDGFSALVDRYKVYDPAGLVRAAAAKGLQGLGRELRDIENADSSGAKHPRFKVSDDATALLMRLT
jgi:hypothetical protein